MKKVSLLVVAAMFAAMFSYTKLQAYSDIKQLEAVKIASASCNKTDHIKAGHKKHHVSGFDNKFTCEYFNDKEHTAKRKIENISKEEKFQKDCMKFRKNPENHTDTSIFSIISPRK